MRIAIASDHAGVQLRQAVGEHLRERGHTVDDLGTDGAASVDYPDYARKVAERVAAGAADRGVLVCGTGQGMAMSANRVRGVRAAVASDTFSARLATEHNDARVMCLGQRVVGVGLALDIVDAWLGASYQGGRHAPRVAKIDAD